MIVYLITNLSNNKKYVGQTKRTMNARWRSHLSKARNGCPYSLHNAIRKYGEESFKIETIFTCSDKATLDMYERGHIQFFHTRDKAKGYNLTDGGEGTLNPSLEHRVAISKALTGRHHSDATRQLISNARKGSTRSEESCRKVSETFMRKRLPHCRNGHEYTPENTQTPPSGGRKCLQCRAFQAREKRAAAKQSSK